MKRQRKSKTFVCILEARAAKQREFITNIDSASRRTSHSMSLDMKYRNKEKVLNTRQAKNYHLNGR